jgi:hypothetical protein
LSLELCCFHLNETRGPFESAGLFGTNKIVARITNDVTCRMHESVAITAAPIKSAKACGVHAINTTVAAPQRYTAATNSEISMPQAPAISARLRRRSQVP